MSWMAFSVIDCERSRYKQLSAFKMERACHGINIFSDIKCKVGRDIRCIKILSSLRKNLFAQKRYGLSTCYALSVIAREGNYLHRCIGELNIVYNKVWNFKLLSPSFPLVSNYIKRMSRIKKRWRYRIINDSIHGTLQFLFNFVILAFT